MSALAKLQRFALAAALTPVLAACSLTSDPLHAAEVGGVDAGGEAVRALSPGAGEPEAEATPRPPPGAAGCSRESPAACADLEPLLPSECESGADCGGARCERGSCVAASCDDGRQNGREQGVDCGGGTCPGCPAGAPCSAGEDCQSLVCGEDARCAEATCEDGVRNQSEPAVDCGDARCGPCAQGASCTEGAHCASGVCSAGTCLPLPCADGARNGDETDVDCGGNDPACPRCQPGRACSVATDCALGQCIAGRCSSCVDGQRTGLETDIDCGGQCGACAPGGACNVDADCQSGACQDGRCCGGSLGDCTRCARRLAQPALTCDSHGPEAVPNCNAFLDCLAANPQVCSIRYGPGCSTVGGACDPTRFGGDVGAGIVLADAIIGTAGCTF